jgi:hypothetical protein
MEEYRERLACPKDPARYWVRTGVFHWSGFVGHCYGTPRGRWTKSVDSDIIVFRLHYPGNSVDLDINILRRNSH